MQLSCVHTTYAENVLELMYAEIGLDERTQVFCMVQFIMHIFEMQKHG